MTEADDFREMERLGDLRFKQTRVPLFEGIDFECNRLVRQAAATGGAKSSGFVHAAAALVAARIPALCDAFIAAYVQPLAADGVTDAGAAWLKKKKEEVWLSAGADVGGLTSRLCQSTGLSAAMVNPKVQEIDRAFRELGERVTDQIEIARLSTKRARSAKPAAAFPPREYSYHPEVQRISGRLLDEGDLLIKN